MKGLQDFLALIRKCVNEYRAFKLIIQYGVVVVPCTLYQTGSRVEDLLSVLSLRDACQFLMPEATVSRQTQTSAIAQP